MQLHRLLWVFVLLVLLPGCFMYKVYPVPLTAPGQAGPSAFDDNLEGKPPTLVVAPVLSANVLGSISAGGGLAVHANLSSLLSITADLQGAIMASSYHFGLYGGYPLSRSSGFVHGNWVLKATTYRTDTREGEKHTTYVTYTGVALPAQTAFLIDGGVRIMDLPFATRENASAPLVKQDAMIIWPRLGIRRKTYWNVTAKGAGKSAAAVSSWWIHAVLPPIGVPGAPEGGDTLYPAYGSDTAEDSDYQDVKSGLVGAAMGIEYPIWISQSVTMRSELAWLPGPYGLEWNVSFSMPLSMFWF